jgi:hypothetical protein
MKRALILLFIILITSCNTDMVKNVEREISWKTRQATEEEYQNLHHGKSYLPVYSHIYYLQENNLYYLSI